MRVVSVRAKLPLLFSALMGLCVLGAEGYVLTGMLRLHAEAVQIASVSVFALIVFAVWLRGYLRSVQFLSRYAHEEAALPKAKTVLEAMAHEVEAGNWNRQDLRADTPLLDRRFARVWRTLRQDAPVVAAERAESPDDSPLSRPEREIRSYRDIALGVGIAGTFVSLLIALGQPQGLTADTLLTQAGAVLSGGLAGAVAGMGLGLCHRTLQDEQDLLTDQVDRTIAESFVAVLPKAVTSPEERMAAATQELAMHATVTLERQTAATQVILTQQAEQYDTLLKAFARQITTILLQQVQQPIQQIADQSTVLARHSGTWAAAVTELKTAHVALLNAQKEGQAQHEKRLDTTFAQYHKALDLSLQVVQQANAAALQETQAFTKRVAALHMQEMTEMAAQTQNRYTALQAEQAAVHQRLNEAAIAAMGGAIETRLATLDERVANTLTALESRLPLTFREGMHEGLAETILLIDSVREQTAGMAHTLGQISGNADRQLQAYERWNERALSVQGRLEQVVTDGQAAQAAQLAQWQTEAAQTLEGVRAAFDGTIYTAQSGFTNLVSALDPLTAELQHLQTTAQELNSALSALPPHATEVAPSLPVQRPEPAPAYSSQRTETASSPHGITAFDPNVPAVPEPVSAPTPILPDWARPDTGKGKTEA
jgi:hypothetical protein